MRHQSQAPLCIVTEPKSSFVVDRQVADPQCSARELQQAAELRAARRWALRTQNRSQGHCAEPKVSPVRRPRPVHRRSWARLQAVLRARVVQKSGSCSSIVRLISACRSTQPLRGTFPKSSPGPRSQHRAKRIHPEISLLMVQNPRARCSRMRCQSVRVKSGCDSRISAKSFPSCPVHPGDAPFALVNPVRYASLKRECRE